MRSRHGWHIATAICATGLLAALALPALLRADDLSDDVARMDASAAILHQIMSMPDRAIPREVLNHARCIAVIPGEKKVAFTVSASYGKGIADCRIPDSNRWGAPLFITIGGGGWGLQIGAQSADVVMVFGDRRGLDSLLSSKFRIGADAAAAAGPVGRNASAATDIKLNSEILSYSRSKGLFAGVSLNGDVVQPDTDGNAAMYGIRTPVSWIVDGRVAAPASARSLIHELTVDSPGQPQPPAQ